MSALMLLRHWLVRSGCGHAIVGPSKSLAFYVPSYVPTYFTRERIELVTSGARSCETDRIEEILFDRT